ncbi:MAG: hypothetical protein KDA80_21535 [Planctomycetaceae bacterium]|nr:hypothetical protein [Planctomycetaceae bacterium]
MFDDVDVFEDGESPFEDDGDVFGGPSPTRRTGSQGKSKSKKKAKKRPRKKPTMSEETKQGLMNFGFTLIALGAASFVLPFIGFQIKGLHALGPEGQMVGGVAFIGIGILMIALSALGDYGANVFELTKWGLIGCLGLGVFGCIGMIGFSFLMTAIASWGDRDAPLPNPGPMGNHAPGQPPVGRVRPGGSLPGPPAEAQLSNYQDNEILNLRLLGFPQDQQRDVVNRIYKQEGGKIWQGNGGFANYEVKMAPIGDVQAVANAIDFANVLSVDPGRREIVLRPKLGATTTRSLPPKNPSGQNTAGATSAQSDRSSTNDTPPSASPFQPAGGGAEDSADMKTNDSPFKPADSSPESPFQPANSPKPDGESPFQPAETKQDGSPFQPAESKSDSPFQPVE